MKGKAGGGFSLVEVLAVAAVIAVLVTVTFQSFSRSRWEAEQKSREADAKVLNDAVVRVQLEGKPGDWATLSNIIHVDKDAGAAIEFLRSNNYVRMSDKED